MEECAEHQGGCGAHEVRGGPGIIELMRLAIRLLREADGRWIGDVPELPGVTVYGSSPRDARLKAEVLALQVVAEEVAFGEMAIGG